jgi:bifunctional DNA-binding transcriptional regulator/antitoxin component of YhaV-PrlF toxin-antitoxin module
MIAADKRQAYIDEMMVSRLDADGKLALPKELVELLGLSPGDQVGFHVKDGQAVLFRDDPDEVEPITGLTTREIRVLLAEAEEGEPVPAEEAFAQVRAHIEEVARKANAA